MGKPQKSPISTNIGHFLNRKPESSNNLIWVSVFYIRLKPNGLYERHKTTRQRRDPQRIGQSITQVYHQKRPTVKAVGCFSPPTVQIALPSNWWDQG